MRVPWWFIQKEQEELDFELTLAEIMALPEAV